MSIVPLHTSKVGQWERYFRDVGLREDLVNSYLPFVGDCIKQDIPPIFEREHLALLLGRDLQTMTAMMEGTDSFYRSFRIKKRSGGSREIRAPYPSLLEAQRWIADNVLASIKLPNCVTGFRPNYSILDNARMHCGRDELLKIDIKDFFPSISFRRIMYVFVKLGYPQNVAYMLSKLCTLDDKLPQGAASSPSLSNIVCQSMDTRFYRLCKANRLRYTRYADDIAISGKKIPIGVRRLLFEIIESEGFEVNEKKVRFLREGERKIVTGLDITSGSVRVTRRFRREIQKDVYFVWSAGLSAHISRRKLFFPNYIDHLEGRVQFWATVEPGNLQMLKTQQRVKSLRIKYGPTRV
ncbi:reverse transcriptase family protein [Rhodobacteraceae bacterium D3-12]|nr:reverse transcriptase family protein [Rhodobacteraceae bacterium D3-12]